MSAATAPITNAPPLLWAAARALISTLFAFFGEPTHIAAQHTHTKRQRSLLLKWLRAAEACLRHLLLIEAAHYPKHNTRTPPPRKPRERVRIFLSFEADQPDAWRVSFHCMDRQLPAGAARHHQTPDDRFRAAYLDPPKLYSVWPLAERAEALLRAFNNPEPYARRLAARLHATPHRACDLTQYPEHLPHVIDEYETLRDTAEIARRRFESG